MDQTLPPNRTPGVLASLRAGLGFAAQVLIGAMLIFVASLVAMMTALAGLMLAGAALVLRYAAVRQPVPVPGTYGVIVIAPGYRTLASDSALSLEATTPAFYDPWGDIRLKVE